MRRAEVSPAALGSIALHGAVAAAFLISWGSRDLKIGAVTPVTIVASAPDTDTRPALQAPETQTAQTEAPTPAPPEPAPPSAPPQPAAAPAAPRTADKGPAPAKPQPKPAEKAFDLDALAASLTRPARNAQQRPAAAAQGAARPETAPVARQTTGRGLAAGADLQGLVSELQRRWNPNCDVEGGRDVVVRATFQVGAGGRVVGDVASQIQSGGTAVARVAQERAVRAVYGLPPTVIPRDYYGERISVTFDARQACANP